ncbi:MAG TPA: hypothetical protein VF092_00945 [Longimicrobium sp.]
MKLPRLVYGGAAPASLQRASRWMPAPAPGVVPQTCEQGCTCMTTHAADLNPYRYQPCRSTVPNQQCMCLRSRDGAFTCADAESMQAYLALHNGANPDGWGLANGYVCRVELDDRVRDPILVGTPIYVNN